jgi:hypothetical protein
MSRRRKRAPILSPSFVWIGSASHDAGSEAFRARQQERMKRMQTKPEGNVATIKRRTA